MHDLIEVYLEVLPLPAACWPAWVVRDENATLVTVDPSSTRAEVALWAPLHLTEQEMNLYRYAYGQPLVPRPLDEWWMTDSCYPAEVPSMLQLPPLSQQEVAFRAQRARERAVERMLGATQRGQTA